MICYHGTDKKCYDDIMKIGAAAWTHWTPFLSTALQMGGPYVVAAYFDKVDDEWLGRGGWEYQNEKHPQTDPQHRAAHGRVFRDADGQRQL